MTPSRQILSEAQRRSIALSTARINLWEGAIRSGKTIGSLIRWVHYVSREAPRSGILFMVGQTKDTINRNVLQPLMDPAVFGPIAAHVHYTQGADTCVIFGRTVHLVGAKDVKAFGRIRGATSAGAYVDEATLLPANFLTELLGRMSLKGAKLFATTNPDSPAHWLKREFIDRARDLNMRVFSFTLDDNPSLDPAYVKAIKAEHTGLWHRRLIQGHWVAAEGVIYEAWNPDLHVTADIPRIDTWLSVGLDYGTTNPLDASLIGLGTGADGVRRLYVTDEWRHDPKVARRRLTDVEHSTNVREWLQQTPRFDGTTEKGVSPRFIVVDPSAASFIQQLNHDRVGNIAPAKNDVVPGIRTVSSLLAADRLRVHPSCAPLIDEMSSYSWDDKATEKGEDKPLKVADHAVDGLRYGIHTTEPLWRGQIGRLTDAAA
ncbi:phage terminase, large subunit, PBSX family [Nocardioides sp. YR527]|uniref:PBSX family phage terminase large subunit n=1 Tax=Nocardioides sp. YR527 TaxID=1881028 RepID=UPI00088714BA|nr:PBSX family phage terminase large subunit [Nocardioides sp. YR527]SDL14768.1 phage terminase, large subunit, PBSX family [Nocardioides sp. YR527]